MDSNSRNDQFKKGDGVDLTPRLYSDSIEFMQAYIAHMRGNNDLSTIPDMLNRFNDRISDGKDIGLDQLRQLAAYATDKIYRFAAEVEMRDAYTVTYFKEVIAKLMSSLQRKGIEVFYILDNKMRGDRFELAVMLYELSGAVVIAPYAGNRTMGFEEVEERLKSPMAHGRNIVYIEKDASVNYIERVMKVATESRYIAIFRSYGPSHKYIKIL